MNQLTRMEGEILALRTLVGLTIGRLAQVANHEKGLLNVMANNAFTSIDGVEIVGDPTVAQQVRTVAKAYVQNLINGIGMTN